MSATPNTRSKRSVGGAAPYRSPDKFVVIFSNRMILLFNYLLLPSPLIVCFSKPRNIMSDPRVYRGNTYSRVWYTSFYIWSFEFHYYSFIFSLLNSKKVHLFINLRPLAQHLLFYKHKRKARQLQQEPKQKPRGYHPRQNQVHLQRVYIHLLSIIASFRSQLSAKPFF